MPIEQVKENIEKMKDFLTGGTKELDESPLQEPTSSIKLKYPHHLALTMEGIVTQSQLQKEDLNETCRKSFVILNNLLKVQIKNNIPIMSIMIVPQSYRKDAEQYVVLCDAITKFLNEFKKNPFVHEHKIKISVLGKWYDLPGKLVEEIKSATHETKDYDSFFLNLCLNYDGREEIVDAIRLIARQVKVGKLDPDLITQSVVKDNIYASYFVPPGLVIKTGVEQRIPQMLQWDSANAKIYFTEKYWPSLKISDLMKAFKMYQK